MYFVRTIAIVRTYLWSPIVDAQNAVARSVVRFMHLMAAEDAFLMNLSPATEAAAVQCFHIVLIAGSQQSSIDYVNKYGSTFTAPQLPAGRLSSLIIVRPF